MNEKLIDFLKKYYGYDSFRLGQEDVIREIVSGRDSLSVMPTGAGKSLIFQMSALMFDGITLVISPLISLMRDQVYALKQNGIPAAFINSSLTAGQTAKALDFARNGSYKIIYVAPERLQTNNFVDFAKNADISLVAVDEAHCVSHWGQDFRPSYLTIKSFVNSLPKKPVVTAFTATATDIVKNDIAKLLALNNPFILSTGFNRENLYFEVRHPRNKYIELAAYLQENEGKSGIIYCATRKTVDELYCMLNKDGFSAARYHAGMAPNERSQAQDDFVYDRVKVITATNAFGMGIDKSNVGFVIHYNMPKNMESYYQEAGRAGRDGTPADCLLFFSGQDIVINKFLINKTDDNSFLTDEEIKQAKMLDFKRLAQMEAYCKTTKCLRKYILDYFGDDEDVKCENCGSCLGIREPTELTAPALSKKALRKQTAAHKNVDGKLFEKLRALRKELADKEKVPAFVIFSDATLFDICAKLPQNEEEFLNVSGIGQVKLLKYGAAFLEAVKAYES